MDWSVLWTAVGGSAQAAAAIATFVAVCVALWLGVREGRRSLQARYDDARPILIIKSEPQRIPVHPGSDWYLDWSAVPPVLTLYDAGNGPAFNVRSVIYGPEAISAPDPKGAWQYWVGVEAEEEREEHWYHWTVDAISQGKERELRYTLASSFNPKVFSGAKKFIESKDRKQKYTFNAPKLEAPRTCVREIGAPHMGQATRTTKLVLSLSRRDQGGANRQKRADLDATAAVLTAARADLTSTSFWRMQASSPSG